MGSNASGEVCDHSGSPTVSQGPADFRVKSFLLWEPPFRKEIQWTHPLGMPCKCGLIQTLVKDQCEAKKMAPGASMVTMIMALESIADRMRTRAQ